MTPESFEELLEVMHQEELQISKTKGKEYTRGDQLDNFTRIGKEIDVDPKKVLYIPLKKHLDSIVSYIKEGKVYSESIESRIMDARVYLSLLRGLIEEEKKK